MQQRLAIAQALVKDPLVLRLDEPFGALDPGIRLDMHDLIADLWKSRGLTVLMVTHDIHEAFKLGTRMLSFDKRRHDPMRRTALDRPRSTMSGWAERLRPASRRSCRRPPDHSATEGKLSSTTGSSASLGAGAGGLPSALPCSSGVGVGSGSASVLRKS